MTHVDLIEKLLKYGLTIHSLYAILHTGHAANSWNRYNPAERDAKKAAMA